MTIGRKLGICCAGLFALSAAAGAAGWYGVISLGNQLEKSIQVTTRQIELAGELKANVFAFRLQERGLLLFSHIHAVEQVTACSQAFERSLALSREELRQIRLLVPDERGRQLTNQIEAAIQEYSSHQAEVKELLASDNVAEATEWDRETLVPAGGRIIAAIDKFSELQHSLNGQATVESVRIRQQAEIVLAAGFVLSIPMACAIGLVLLRLSRQLRKTALELRENGTQVANAASQISSAGQGLAQGSSEHASSLEEISASSEEIKAMGEKATDSMRSASEMVKHSESQFAETTQSLDQMVVAMREITESSSKISKVIKVINEIAFQTNILALNAAVEAARAGEAGLGFAVVADEVRSLAHRCAEAARETESMIADSISKAAHGRSKMDRVAAAIQCIAGDSAGVRALVEEVYDGSQKQTRAMAKISGAIFQLYRVTQTTAAHAEESAAAAEQLSAQSEVMKDMVDDLANLVGSEAS